MNLETCIDSIFGAHTHKGEESEWLSGDLLSR